jgi:bacterioferritin-associated ferredoxin
MADTFGTLSACVGIGSTCGGCGPGAGVVEGQDLQEVRVKDSEVAGDLVVECRG